MNAIRTLLVIEDNPGDVGLLCEMLADETLRPELVHAATMREAESHLAVRTVDIILLDLSLPDAHGIQALRRIRAAAPDIPLVVLTGIDDDDLARLSMQEGAQDYLIKGEMETRGLIRALRYASERKRLERLKNEFVATVSHELRTPLTSITASLGLMLGTSGGTLPVPIARLLGIAHTNCKRLVRLVNDILDIERLESGQLDFDLRRIDVRGLVEQAVESNQALAQHAGVRLRIEGAIDAIADVRADADRLSQVFSNLLSNAIKFSAADDEVLVTVEREADTVRICVRDHGPGIAAAFQSSIFGRFAQADATDTRLKGGTGLGLYIVRQIVTRLGGTVGFVNALDGGTVFAIELPSWGGDADTLQQAEIEAATLLDAETSLQTLLGQARDRMPLALPLQQSA